MHPDKKIQLTSHIRVSSPYESDSTEQQLQKAMELLPRINNKPENEIHYSALDWPYAGRVHEVAGGIFAAILPYASCLVIHISDLYIDSTFCYELAARFMHGSEEAVCAFYSATPTSTYFGNAYPHYISNYGDKYGCMLILRRIYDENKEYVRYELEVLSMGPSDFGNLATLNMDTPHSLLIKYARDWRSRGFLSEYKDFLEASEAAKI